MAVCLQFFALDSTAVVTLVEVPTVVSQFPPREEIEQELGHVLKGMITQEIVLLSASANPSGGHH